MMDIADKVLLDWSYDTRQEAADEIERLREALDHILKVNPSAENAGYIMRAIAVNALQQKESE